MPEDRDRAGGYQPRFDELPWQMRPRTIAEAPKADVARCSSGFSGRSRSDLPAAQRWSSTAILQWVRTLTVSLPRTIAEIRGGRQSHDD